MKMKTSVTQNRAAQFFSVLFHRKVFATILSKFNVFERLLSSKNMTQIMEKLQDYKVKFKINSLQLKCHYQSQKPELSDSDKN